LGIFLRGILDEVAEYGLVIVSNQQNLAHVGDLSHRLQAVVDDGVAGDFE
jgi:hypothetical protein